MFMLNWCTKRRSSNALQIRNEYSGRFYPFAGSHPFSF
jgi:hypothetical protein